MYSQVFWQEVDQSSNYNRKRYQPGRNYSSISVHNTELISTAFCDMLHKFVYGLFASYGVWCVRLIKCDGNFHTHGSRGRDDIIIGLMFIFRLPHSDHQ